MFLFTAPGAPCARSAPPVSRGVSVAQCQERIFTWFGQGSCKGLRYPTVLSYLVYSVPKFQSNCCAQKVKKQKQKERKKHKETKNDKHGAWFIQKYQDEVPWQDNRRASFLLFERFRAGHLKRANNAATSNKRSHSNGKFTYNSEMRKPKRNWQMYLKITDRAGRYIEFTQYIRNEK